MNPISPYPGLRPFTEEESIFFKGRDLHIEQVTKQLEQKKFVMLTGASGDGKSSLIYAGVIPNARAGFFKAKYNNWLFATFRPERNPLENFAKAVSEQMNLNYEDVRKELSFGFSALVNLYKKSPFYLDQNSESFKNTDDTEKKKLKRKAANLFILIDQFEEFFTNPENYSQGIPSNDAQTVINLLLETAKIALEQDLPIYIVCTMRSDYIGQCAAFRGLPEMIGFSQFFVPRLKRKEIYQVIEEPATLAGCKISQRLVENLINGMNEGFDQLPVLQHALNGIWNEANKGTEEMDLLHLAKITGLSSSTLPKSEKQKFSEWFARLPEFRKKHFSAFGLEKVLGTHADTLYETAHDYYNKQIGDEQLSIENAQQIIKTTFQCLTRIDASRAVRNRMNLQEISDIINEPGIDATVVGNVLNIFREQGNTLISPFINNEKPETRNLKPETVLDITHESLIRNWTRLREWAKEENENYLTWQDFNKQLQRWVNSENSPGYLLPIGPLNYFEDWFNTAKPNKYWLARYSPTPTLPKGEGEKAREEKLQKAEQTLAQAREFIKKSARKLFVTRTIMYYGANKVAAFFAILALFAVCTYYYFDFRKKQNVAVIERIEERGIELINSDKVNLEQKANFIINYERNHPNSFERILNGLENDSLAFDIAEQAFKMAVPADNGKNKTINSSIEARWLKYLDARLENLLNQKLFNSKKINNKDLSRINNLIKTTFIRNYFLSDTVIKKIFDKNIWQLHKIIDNSFNPPTDSLAPCDKEMYISLYNLLLLNDSNLLIAGKEIFNRFIPDFGEEQRKTFNKLFPNETKWEFRKSPLKGGYHLISYYYAKHGNMEKVFEIVDSIKSHYPNPSFNHYHYLYQLLNIFIKNGHITETNFEKIIAKYQSIYTTTTALSSDFAETTISNLFDDITKIEFDYIPVSLISSNEQKQIIWDYCKYSIEKLIKNNQNDELNFKLATYYKNIFIYWHILGLEHDYLAEKSFYYFNKTSQKYISGNRILKTYVRGNAISSYYRIADAFVFPSFVNEAVFSASIQSFKNFPFANFIIENKADYLYKSKDDFNTYFRFLKMYFSENKSYFERYEKMDMNNLYQFNYFDYGNILLKKCQSKEGDYNQEFLDLFQLNTTLFAVIKDSANNTTDIYKKINYEKISSKSFMNNEVHRHLLKQLAINLSILNSFEESMKIINSFEPHFKRNTLIDIGEELQKKGPAENIPLYLEEFFNSINNEKTKISGLKILKVIGMVGSKPMYELAFQMLKDVPEVLKPRALVNFIRGIIHNGNYYTATQYIPEYISSSKELQLHNEILHHHILSKELNNSVGWEQYDKNFTSNYGADYEYAPGEDIKFDSLD